MEININIHEFKKRFDDEYGFLYDNYDRVVGYSKAVEWGGQVHIR